MISVAEWWVWNLNAPCFSNHGILGFAPASNPEAYVNESIDQNVMSICKLDMLTTSENGLSSATVCIDMWSLRVLCTYQQYNPNYSGWALDLPRVDDRPDTSVREMWTHLQCICCMASQYVCQTGGCPLQSAAYHKVVVMHRHTDFPTLT